MNWIDSLAAEIVREWLKEHDADEMIGEVKAQIERHYEAAVKCQACNGTGQTSFGACRCLACHGTGKAVPQ